MKRLSFTAVLLLFIAMAAFSQMGTGSAPMAVKTMYLLPKRGMEDKFEAAVLAHIKKFHGDGPYNGRLRKVNFGEKAGWYVMVLGPTPYTTLDNPLSKESGHDADWDTNVDPLIEQYGQTVLWNYETDLSYGMDIMRKAKHNEIYAVTLKPGQYEKFKAMAAKLKKVYESLGNTAFLVLTNDTHETNGPDVGIVWSFDSYDAWQKDPGPKAAYEKMYGQGSWQKLMDDWHNMVASYYSELRSPVQ